MAINNFFAKVSQVFAQSVIMYNRVRQRWKNRNSRNKPTLNLHKHSIIFSSLLFVPTFKIELSFDSYSDNRIFYCIDSNWLGSHRKTTDIENNMRNLVWILIYDRRFRKYQNPITVTTSVNVISALYFFINNIFRRKAN